jgi:hypothetical protein
MEKFFQDLRFALRVYAKNRSFTIIAVLALAIGIGSNIAVFTVVNALLFRLLPYPDADRLVQVGRSLNEGPVYPMSYARFRFLEQNNRTFELLAAYDVVGSSLSITLGETPELVQSSRVSADFFRVLQVSPLLGRSFTAEDDKPGVASVAVISYNAWSRLFGNDPNVVGRLVRMSGEAYTIAGVLPADFKFGDDTEVWLTIRKAEGALHEKSYQTSSLCNLWVLWASVVEQIVRKNNHRGTEDPEVAQRNQTFRAKPAEDWTDRSNPYLVIGRLRPGTTLGTAHSELTTLFQRLQEQQPASVAQTEVGALITPYRERVVGNTRVPLLLLAGVVGCVLLIACANVANLLLRAPSGDGRKWRCALGINQSRMIRQFADREFFAECDQWSRRISVRDCGAGRI